MKDLQWFNEKVRVLDLKGLENNPRKIGDAERAKLQRSLEKFNLAEVPLCNSDMTIISGNQRVAALIALGRGDEFIDVRVPSRRLNKLEVKEYALTANTHNGEWDYEVLREHYAEVELGEFNIELPVEIPPFDGGSVGGGGGAKKDNLLEIPLAPEQRKVIDAALGEIKATEEFKWCEGFGNENQTAKALYMMATDWMRDNGH